MTVKSLHGYLNKNKKQIDIYLNIYFEKTKNAKKQVMVLNSQTWHPVLFV